MSAKDTLVAEKHDINPEASRKLKHNFSSRSFPVTILMRAGSMTQFTNTANVNTQCVKEQRRIQHGENNASSKLVERVSAQSASIVKAASGIMRPPKCRRLRFFGGVQRRPKASRW